MLQYCAIKAPAASWLYMSWEHIGEGIKIINKYGKRAALARKLRVTNANQRIWERTETTKRDWLAGIILKPWQPNFLLRLSLIFLLRNLACFLIFAWYKMALLWSILLSLKRMGMRQYISHKCTSPRRSAAFFPSNNKYKSTACVKQFREVMRRKRYLPV